jgi:hypothetical protein
VRCCACSGAHGVAALHAIQISNAMTAPMIEPMMPGLQEPVVGVLVKQQVAQQATYEEPTIPSTMVARTDRS